MISYRPTDDLLTSAAITYANMHPFYAHYSVDWQQPKILEQARFVCHLIVTDATCEMYKLTGHFKIKASAHKLWQSRCD